MQRVLAGAVLAWFLLTALHVRSKAFARSWHDGAASWVARPWWRSRAAQVVLSLAVVALIFGFFFPKVADYGEVWQTITAMTPLELGTLVGRGGVEPGRATGRC